VLREAPGFLLGEDEPAVAQHVELPFVARDVLRWNSVRLQLGRETRGPVVIARSGWAIEDLNRHVVEPTGAKPA
jgi:hypothetical protein